MKIALVQCPGWGRDCPPYTLALFSAILKKEGYAVDSYDLNNTLYCSGPDEYRKYWDDKDLYSFWGDDGAVKRFIRDNKSMLEFQVERILRSDASLIGFTVHFTSLMTSLEVARMIKKADRDRIIVFGGPDCCHGLRAEFIIKEGPVDAVAIGEGDLTLLELAKQVREKGRIGFCKGALVRNGSGFIDCGQSRIVKNINALPFPDYSDFSEDIKAGLYSEPRRLEIFDSRGCITRCHFCSEWQFWKNYRTMKGERMFREVRHQTGLFPGVDYFYFIGSLLNGNISELSRFCDILIENKLRIRWAGQAVVRSDMTEKLLNKMRRAGCEWLGFGIESGSKRVVHSMNKRFSINDAENNLRYAHRAGIMVQANFMFGIPGETEEDFEETIAFLRRNRENIDSVLASQSFCVIDNGTYLYNHAEKFDIRDRDHHLYWEADGGKNTYPERFRRYEEFCQVALSLGLPETSGVLRKKPDKWYLLGDYYDFKKDYNKALDCYKKSLSFESHNEIVSKKIKLYAKTPSFDFLESLFMKYIWENDHDFRNFKAWMESYFKKLIDVFDKVTFNDLQNSVVEVLYSRRLFRKLFNFIIVEVQKINRSERVLGYPYWLTIDPANVCTLKCPFCPTGQGRNSRKKTVLSLDNFKALIEEAGPYLIHIDFCNWGEPLLNPDIYEIIKMAKRYHIDTKIDSNFNQFKEEDAERLIQSGLDKIVLSIDGASPETYSKYRVNGNFDKVMNNLRILLEKKKEMKRANPYITWQFLVFRHNEHEIGRIKKIGRDLKVDEVCATKAFIGDKDWMPRNREYSNYDLEKVEASADRKDRTSAYFRSSENRLCNWPWEAMAINPNGSVSPCCSVEDEKDDFGNVFQDGFMSVWNNENYLAARKYIKNNGTAKNSAENICFDCKQAGLINLDLLSSRIISDTIREDLGRLNAPEGLSASHSLTPENSPAVNKKTEPSRANEKKIALESSPTTLMAILTTNCNLRCIMCSRVKSESTLPFETIKKVFSLFPFLEVTDWQGGEVFLLDYFKELFLEAARHPNILQHITTNGLLIDREWARIFSDANVNLLYSVDAVTKSTYEDIRRGGKFSAFLKSLDLVNEANRKYNGNTGLELTAAVMKRNYKELHLFPHFCKHHNFDILNFDMLWPDVIPEEDIFIRPDAVALDYLKETIPEIRERCREYGISFQCTFEPYLEDARTEDLDNGKRISERAEARYNCNYPWKHLHIEPDGRVYPACMCKTSIGNLKDSSWEEIWSSKTMRLYRSLLVKGKGNEICSEQCKVYQSLKRVDIPQIE